MDNSPKVPTLEQMVNQYNDLAKTILTLRQVLAFLDKVEVKGEEVKTMYVSKTFLTTLIGINDQLAQGLKAQIEDLTKKEKTNEQV